MSTDLRVRPSSLSSASNGSPEPSSPGANLGGRMVEVITTGDFATFKRQLKNNLNFHLSSSKSDVTKGMLYAVAGVVLIAAVVAIVCYLKVVIPVTFVWPGISKLLVASGISVLALGSLFSFAMAQEAFQRGFDRFDFSNRVENQARNMTTYQVDRASLQQV